MDDKDLSKYRSDVIERAINLEWIMSTIICQHYFKRVILGFLTEVLYDEYFSFGLKRRIIEKIIKNFDKEKLQDLNRLNTIRNYFAHCNKEFFEGAGIPAKDAKGKGIDPRRLDKESDFEKLYNEFKSIIDKLENYLFSIYFKLGGEAYNQRGSKVQFPSQLESQEK